MDNNLIILHGGGPTAVINASLFGAIREAQENPQVVKSVWPWAAPAAS